MSGEEKKDNKPQVCEVFEPQAWRKSACRNCFQPPEKHATIGGGNLVAGSDPRQEDIRTSISPEKRVSSGTDAGSIKNKYEQLEKDKLKHKQPPPKVMPKPSPSPDRSKNIPTSPVENKANTLMKSKFGSVENISSVGTKATLNVVQKQKFGSIENLSGQSKNESVSIPIQRSKFGGSMESVSIIQEESKSFQSKTHNMLNKLDAFSNEFKIAATSQTSTSTVIHTKIDGRTEITSPSKTMRNPFLTIKDARTEPATGKPSEPPKGKEIKVLHIKTQESKDENKSPVVEKDVKKKPGFKLPTTSEPDPLFSKPLLKKPTVDKVKLQDNKAKPVGTDTSVDDSKSLPVEKDVKKISGFKLPTTTEPDPMFSKPLLRKASIDKDKLPENKVKPVDTDTPSDFRKVDLRGGLKKKNETVEKKDAPKAETSKAFELPALKSKTVKQDTKEETNTDVKQDSKVETNKGVKQESKDNLSKHVSNDKDTEMTTVPSKRFAKPELKSSKESPTNKSETSTGSTATKVESKVNQLGFKVTKDKGDTKQPGLGITKIGTADEKTSDAAKNKNMPKSLQNKKQSKDSDSKPASLWSTIKSNALGNKLKKEESEVKAKLDKSEDNKTKPGKLGQQGANKEESKNKIELPKLKSSREETKKPETKTEEPQAGGKGLPFKLNKVDTQKSSDPKKVGVQTKADKQDDKSTEELKVKRPGLNSIKTDPKTDTKKADVHKVADKQDDKPHATEELKVKRPGLNTIKTDPNIDTKKADEQIKTDKPDVKPQSTDEEKVKRPGLNSIKTDTKKDPEKKDLKSPNTDETKNRFERPALKSAKADSKQEQTKPELKVSAEDTQKNKFVRPGLKPSKPEVTETANDQHKPDAKDQTVEKQHETVGRPPLKSVDPKSKELPKDSKTSVEKDSKDKIDPSVLKPHKSERDTKVDKNVDSSSQSAKDKPKTPFKNESEPVKQAGEKNLKNLLSGLKSTKSDDKDKKTLPHQLKSQDKEKEQTIGSDVELSKNKFSRPALKTVKKDDGAGVNKETNKDIESKLSESNTEVRRKSITTKEEKSLPETNVKQKQQNNIPDKRDSAKDKPAITEHAKPSSVTLKDISNNNEIKKDKNKITSPTKSPEKDKSISKVKDPVTGNHSTKASQNENSVDGSVTTNDIKISEPAKSASIISDDTFDDISDGKEAVADGLNGACAKGSAHVHVDTQVFTSSRNKAAGVAGSLNSEQKSSKPKLDFSALGLTDSAHNKDSWKSGGELQNGNVSRNLGLETNTAKEVDKVSRVNEAELEKLRSELLLMTERCHNLEKENENLSKGLSKKESDALELKKQKNEVESTVNGLRGQMKKMEERCSNLESDNSILSGDLKIQKELTQTGDNEDKMTTKDKMMEDMLEENETLRQEINDLKAEMEEMYDSFRDQEAEEFRELQKELEITAKNCRILQFKLRKMDRRNVQVEHDRDVYEDKLRILQNQFQDRDAVAHIHSLEDELRMAKEVSVRLHDELDLMEDKRSKLHDENQHLTELLEQSDRKQFRLELEVDKLRDKVVQLKDDVRLASGEAPRKVSLEVVGRQSSQELEVQQLKRELYDSKEREADIRDQMQFLDDNGKKLQRIVRDLEEENENLSTQLKKMSRERARDPDSPTNKSGNDGSRDTARRQTEVELRIQFELMEKELSAMKRNMADLVEENEMLHGEMFSLEQMMKEKDRQLQEVPEPSSPSVYYADKIKEFEKEADDFRSKLLDKEQELERVYAQLNTYQAAARQGHSLRKTKSLDLEDSYHVMVDLKRQLELSQQECLMLRERELRLEEELVTMKHDLDKLEVTLKEDTETNQPGLTALAVAYVDTDDSELRTELEHEKNARQRLADEIERLAEKMISSAENLYPSLDIERISNIPKKRGSVGAHLVQGGGGYDDNRLNLCSSESGEMSRVQEESRDPRQQQTNSAAIISGDFPACPGTCSLSDSSDCEAQTIISESGEADSPCTPRDPLILLSVINDIFHELVQVSAGRMASEGAEQVPFSSALPECDARDFDVPDGVQKPSDTSVCEPDVVSDLCDSRDDALNESMNLNEQSVATVEMDRGPKEELTTDLDEMSDQSEASDKPEARESPEAISSIEGGKGPGDTESGDYIVTKDTISESTADDIQAVDATPDNELEKLRAQIVDLEEEVDDLRMIIHSKEQKNVLLEEELQEMDDYTKRIQEDSRKRETELFQEMDLIHGKNEILNNLLEFVKERAEAAEDELERVIAEVNEAQGSSVSSEKGSASQRASVGSDDVFDGSPVEKAHFATVWEEQFKKRIRSLEKLLAEERNKVTSLEKKLEISGSELISSALSDDAKLHHREKELLQSELQESERYAKMANDQIRSLTEKLKKADSEKWRSPKLPRKDVQEPSCQTCAELQSVKNELSEELVRFKSKAEELELKVEETGLPLNDVWVSKSAASEKDRQILDQRLRQKCQECKRLEEQLNKLREEDRMKDIFLKERDNNLKDKAAQISRKDELIHEQEDIIRQREEDLQALFDQISQREKTMKEMEAEIKVRNDRLKAKEEVVKQMQANLEEKNEELHYLEEEMQESNIKRKESETIIAEMQEKIGAALKGEKSELETENERLQTDVDSLMGNIAELHSDKVTLQSELEKAKQALSEAMLMWDRDRSTLGCELNKATERLRMYELTSKQKESQALQTMRKEVHSIIDSREKLAHELRISKMEHENAVRLLKTEKFKLTEDLTSKMRMLAHEISNNDKMSDELAKLRGQDDINFQLHHHEKILKAEYMAMKVRYESQLDRLQKEHINLLNVVEKLQREKNLDQDIIEGIQKGMSNIKSTYTSDLSRWKDERNILESHISQIEEGKEIALHLKAQIDSLKQQLSDQEMERSSLVNKMTQERRAWDMEKAQLNSRINQLEEQLALFIQHESKSKDVQVKMEIAWEKEREEQKRLLAEAHSLAMDLQVQLHKRDEEHNRERKNLQEQMEKQRSEADRDRMGKDRLELEINTGETKARHLEQQISELKEKQKKDQEVWVKEKGELLRRLADMRKTHMRDVRRIDDVLASLKRLRELSAIVIESDHSATLPSNGSDGGATSGDASAASSSSTGGEGEMTDLKQNIDQVILKYVKESLRQLHLAVEELARPTEDMSRDDKHKMRRSLSSSEIELLKDEFLLGSIDPGHIFRSCEAGPGTQTTTSGPGEEQVTIQRSITSDGNNVDTDRLPPDYIENILMEQSSFYNDSKDTKTEVHRVRTTKDVTRIETKVTTLPKPPPSFIIPRSRSTSPAPYSKGKQPVIKTIPIDTSNAHRLSAPVLTGDHARSSSADSSPMGSCPSTMASRHNGLSLYSGGTIQAGSLDRLSPTTARKKFFEANTVSNLPYLSWPERKKQLSQNRNSRSLSNSSDLVLASSADAPIANPLRISVSMDDGAITAEPEEEQAQGEKPEARQGTSLEELPGKHHSGFRDMFKTVKRKLKPKLKRSQSAREPDRLKAVVESEKSVHVDSELSARDEKHVVQERMTHIAIPDVEAGEKKETSGEEKKRGRSRSPGGKRGGESRDSSVTPETTLQKIKKRFRSKSADRTRDHQVKPILVGHSSGSQTTDSGFQFSETKV